METAYAEAVASSRVLALPQDSTLTPADILEEENTTQCPVSYYPEVLIVLEAARHYNNGVMPHAGGWADQPAKLMRFIQIVNAEEARHNATK